MITDFRFLFDQHVNGMAKGRLRLAGFDVLHVAETGLSRASDADILAHAAADGRIVVTRNYRDFAPLVHEYIRQARSLPGVLCYARSIPHSDVGGHVRALNEWVHDAHVEGRKSIDGGVGWLC